MRKLIAFSCAGETLLGSLDGAPGTSGLLIVSGGNEPRMGAHRGMALLARRVAAAGWPVFRFDRRGVGDSAGANGGWSASAPDLAAAAAAFRREAPQVARLVGFGNCDAATALALFGAAAGIDALVLANPWVVERDGDLPPPAAIRARYAARLRSPREWLRLLRGGVDFHKLHRGLRSLAAPSRQQPLARRFADALREQAATIVLARGDATAIAYADAVKEVDGGTRWIETDSHSFAREGDMAGVEEVIVAALRAHRSGAGKKRDPGSSPG